MTYELKAGYEFRAVLAWHIATEGESRGLCDQPLAPAARTRSIKDTQQTRATCPACRGAHVHTGGLRLAIHA